VMPTYWVALMLTIGMSLAGGNAPPSVGDFLWSLTLLPSHGEPLLGVAWTLQYEIVFYGIFSALIVNRAGGTTALTLWLLSIGLAVTGVSVFAGLPSSLCGIYSVEFFLGMAAAYGLRTFVLPLPGVVALAGGALFAVAAAAEDVGLLDGYDPLARFAYGLPAMALILGAAEIGRQGRSAIPRPLRVLGAASYSIYLFQFVFIGLLWKAWRVLGFDGRVPDAVCFVVLAAGGIGGGIVMSKAVEYPLMRLVRGDWRKMALRPPGRP